jgi:hypothetical protein
MSAPFSTLLLDLQGWDLVLDSKANIAVAAPPYALAQDVASAIKTFLGEVWYDDSLGVPYLQKILGQAPPITVLQQAMVDAAMTVPGVTGAVCVIQAFDRAARSVVGQVQFVDSSGATQTVSI